ncbi:MAG: AraC family transcriptional regulator [Blastocatellia bacterium]|jgi:AraC family transcriptional regulator of adaptative response/methylated-DNA-[protein]-cysteine methyltransferase|nr:AraC family transcriptional regulator [Blastocatellia bacterium]
MTQQNQITPRVEEMWSAVMARDNANDGHFVFAVRSTGIYCRPSCPARRPRRDQVQFFMVPEAAENAGFRACRRCRPQTTKVADPALALVGQVCRAIDTTVELPVTLTMLSAQTGVSGPHLQRTFKRVMGITPREYAEAARLGQFKSHVRAGASVTTALYDAGYGSSRGLYEKSSAQMGMTPAVYRRGGRGMIVSYTLCDSPLGRLLVAATAKGVCAVSLGDSDIALEQSLSDEYPAAAITRDDDELKTAVHAILEHLQGKRPHLQLPLDIQATAFQRQVWQALQEIPYGNTVSYGEIAQRIGRPTAVRAVARACASNRVALVIPCHRVVGKDNKLTGYRWGVERKGKLLEREAGKSS